MKRISIHSTITSQLWMYARGQNHKTLGYKLNLFDLKVIHLQWSIDYCVHWYLQHFSSIMVNKLGSKHLGSSRTLNPKTLLLCLSTSKGFLRAQLGAPIIIYIIQNKKKKKIWLLNRQGKIDHWFNSHFRIQHIYLFIYLILFLCTWSLKKQCRP